MCDAARVIASMCLNFVCECRPVSVSVLLMCELEKMEVRASARMRMKMAGMCDFEPCVILPFKPF